MTKETIQELIDQYKAGKEAGRKLKELLMDFLIELADFVEMSMGHLPAHYEFSRRVQLMEILIKHGVTASVDQYSATFMIEGVVRVDVTPDSDLRYTPEALRVAEPYFW